MSKLKPETISKIISQTEHFDEHHTQRILHRVLDEQPVSAENLHYMASYHHLDDQLGEKIVSHPCLTPNSDMDHFNTRQTILKGMHTWGHGKAKQIAKRRLDSGT